MKSLIKNCAIIAAKVGCRISRILTTSEERTVEQYRIYDTTEQLARYNEMVKKLVFDEAFKEACNDNDEEFDFLVPDYCPCCGQLRSGTLVLVHTTVMKVLF